MITKTSISAIRALMHLAQRPEAGVLSPRRIADELRESPTYMAKVARSLVKAGILRAEKGVKGGVWLGRPPEQIKLLAIVEACQGAILGDYCRDGCPPSAVCSYHRAADELRLATTGVLAKWSLQDLLRKPMGQPGQPGVPCLIAGPLPSVLAPAPRRQR